jgi:hypothetical protein
MPELHLLIELDILLTLAAEHLDKSVGLLLRVSCGLETPALCDFGDTGDQRLQRGLVVKAQEQHDFGHGFGDTRGDGDVVTFELFGGVRGFGLELLQAQDCFQCVTAVGQGDEFGEAEGLYHCLGGDTIPDKADELALALICMIWGGNSKLDQLLVASSVLETAFGEGPLLLIFFEEGWNPEHRAFVWESRCIDNAYVSRCFTFLQHHLDGPDEAKILILVCED